MRKTLYTLLLLALASCGGEKKPADTSRELAPAPEFCADSAMACIRRQCEFGPRIPGTEAHRQCARYITSRFAAYGLQVQAQEATLTAWNGDRLPMTNIVASLNPETEMRLLVTAHWDSRPWADNDPDPANHRTPVLAANDGASGVAVMLEMARVLSAHPLDWGIDFVCFDCEDYGMAQWADDTDDDSRGETWCLGSRTWAMNPHRDAYTALSGINLDMVGGRGSVFLREGVSRHYAPDLVERVWGIAAQLGYASFFPTGNGGYVTDDHVPVNQILGIPTIDILPHYAHCQASSFGPTWHTVNDTPDNIDPAVLKAVGQVVTTYLCNP